MHLLQMNQKIAAEHGVVASFPNDFFGYYGWPTIARMPNGTIVAAASGMRNAHVCPFGRSVFLSSDDDGQTWKGQRVVNDTPLDDRDTGIVSCGGDRILLTWFTTDNRSYREKHTEGFDEERLARWDEGLSRLTVENVRMWVGAWCRTSEDAGETWSDPIRVPLTAPHGPTCLKNGKLLYFGKRFETDMDGFTGGVGSIAAMESGDFGRSWEQLGTVPLYEGTVEGNYHEPHVVELDDGKLVGIVRLEECDEVDPADLGLERFMMTYTESTDGGRTWTTAEPLNFHGSPPHLLLHSSGALICPYGYWEYDYILRDDGPTSDLGYPSSVELDDGSILTAYYQQPETVRDKCALLWSRWRLPV